MQGSSTSILTPGCSCTALSSTGMTECPSGHSLPSIVITYIPFSFLSSSNCCTRNTISTLVFSVSTFQHICFEFGFSHPVAVCGLPPAEWHHDQYPPVSVSQFLCIEIIGQFQHFFSVMKIFIIYNQFSLAFPFLCFASLLVFLCTCSPSFPMMSGCCVWTWDFCWSSFKTIYQLF